MAGACRCPSFFVAIVCGRGGGAVGTFKDGGGAGGEKFVKLASLQILHDRYSIEKLVSFEDQREVRHDTVSGMPA